MLKHLYKYLSLYHHASIPGVGNFVVEQQPARIDFISNTLFPPMQTIIYKPGTAITEKSFYGFLARELNVNDVEAVRKFQDFAYQLKNNINQYKQVELSAFGIFKKDAFGSIVFESTAAPAFFPEMVFKKPIPDSSEVKAVTSEPYSPQLAEIAREEEAKKDYWWIWALLLALIGIGALVYYYWNYME